MECLNSVSAFMIACHHYGHPHCQSIHLSGQVSCIISLNYTQSSAIIHRICKRGRESRLFIGIQWTIPFGSRWTKTLFCSCIFVSSLWLWNTIPLFHGMARSLANKQTSVPRVNIVNKQYWSSIRAEWMNPQQANQWFAIILAWSEQPSRVSRVTTIRLYGQSTAVVEE